MIGEFDKIYNDVMNEGFPKLRKNSPNYDFPLKKFKTLYDKFKDDFGFDDDEFKDWLTQNPNHVPLGKNYPKMSKKDWQQAINAYAQYKK